jgi:hypothetical protein
MSTLTTRTDTAASTSASYAVRHVGWPEPERVVLPEAADPGAGLVITNRSLKRDGRRWIPTSGEIHFSRLARRQWPLALKLLRAGGIDLVSTYVFWNHHQPEYDVEPSFTGNRDIAAFLQLCADEGLPAVVRIGPWAHGEARNGGFPDWLQSSGTRTRTDDPAYLALVRTYFQHLARQIVPFCGPSGPIIAVQIENELYDQPKHIATLKRLAEEVGIRVPIWTATGWGNAQLPVPEVFPVYSGYSEGFWVDADDEWDDSFRSHFFFSDRWDDPGVGKDLAGEAWTGIAGVKHPDLPPATCELAGGMATAYHCRPVPSALDVAALANVKLGSGSAWQGYYMYVGGTNPDGPDGLQESHASSYPNDLPRFNYDFHAPIGRDQRTRESFHRLRAQHAFLDTFEQTLAGMTTTFPPPPDDNRPLRWSLRSDGTSGYVFVNNHQPVEPLGPVPDIQFAVQLDQERVVFPPAPVVIPAGAILALPVAVTVAGVSIRWATFNLMTLLEEDEPVLVGHAHPGLDAQIAVPGGYRVSGGQARAVGEDLVVTLMPGTDSITLQSPQGRRLHLLVLDPTRALRAWIPTLGGHPHLLLSDADIIERDGAVVALAELPTAVATFDATTRMWSEQPLPGAPQPRVSVELLHPLPTGHPAPRSFGGRASAPSRDEMARHSAGYRVSVDAIPTDVERAVLVINLVGDVADITLLGHDAPFDDLFWDGEPWTIDLTPFAGTGELEFDVRVTSFNPEVSIRLPPRADQLGRQHGPVAAVHAADVQLTHATAITLN